MNRKTKYILTFIQTILEGQIDRIKVEVYDAIVDYVLTGNVKVLNSRSKMLFDGFRFTYDNLDLRQMTAQINGVNGGRPKTKTNQNKPKENLVFSAENAENSHAHVIEVNNNLDDKNNKSKIEKESTKKEKEFCEGFIRKFNERLTECRAQIPHNVRLTDRRKHAINARLREYGAEALDQLIDKAANSKFLNGSGGGAWVASLDWLLRPNNFPKVIEGNYDNNKTTNYGNNRQISAEYAQRSAFPATENKPDEY